MNWQKYVVSEVDFKKLIEHNEPIPVAKGILANNSGVEVWSEKGNFVNAIYDAELSAVRNLIGFNPVYTDMPNRDLLLYNDLLLNKNITTIVVDGFFGTGKTSLACSHLVFGLIDRLNGREGISCAYISKPHESLGKTYGHLPGELEDKIIEEFASYFQYFNRFGQPGLVDILTGKKKQEYKLLHFLVFEYIRGIDIESGWVILDEAQNTSIKEMIAFISRVCDEAKLIIIGDSSQFQIDKKGNNPEENGLTFAKKVFKNKKYAGFVEMKSAKHIIRGKRVKDLINYVK